MAKADLSDSLETDSAISVRNKADSDPSSGSPKNSDTLLQIVSILIDPEERQANSKAPPGVCPALYRFIFRPLCDISIDAEEVEMLWPLAARLIDSDSGTATGQRRAQRFADWAVREVLPLALEVNNCQAHAKKLRRLKPIHDRASAAAAEQAAKIFAGGAQSDSCRRAARDAAAAAYSARLWASSAGSAAHYASSAAAHASADIGRGKVLEMRTALLDEVCPDPAAGADLLR